MFQVLLLMVTAATSPGRWPHLPAELPAALKARLAPWHATLVILDPLSGARLDAGDSSPAKRSSPCSTFKIFHALVGLETGVLRDLEHRYEWDGVKHERDELNRDHTLRSAMRDSVVWYFQRLATELGETREKELLAKAGYGNQDILGRAHDVLARRFASDLTREQLAFLAEALPAQSRPRRRRAVLGSFGATASRRHPAARDLARDLVRQDRERGGWAARLVRRVGGEGWRAARHRAAARAARRRRRSGGRLSRRAADCGGGPRRARVALKGSRQDAKPPRHSERLESSLAALGALGGLARDPERTEPRFSLAVRESAGHPGVGVRRDGR